MMAKSRYGASLFAMAKKQKQRKAEILNNRLKQADEEQCREIMKLKQKSMAAKQRDASPGPMARFV